MKLSTALAQQTLHQLEEEANFRDTQVVRDDNPAVPQLNRLFGDHTFFLDSDGLHIVEPAESGAAQAPKGKIIKLAEWTDGNRTTLMPHQPVPTDLVVTLDADEPDKAS
jgi:hypothetical protein